MRRRKLLIGIGAAAAGGSAAFGTEAFTSVQAERNVDVAVAGDRSSFVAIQPLSSSNASTYVDTESDNTVEIELDGDRGSGEGVTQDAITQLEDLFRVVNQGSQEVSVYFEDDSDAVTFRVTRSASTSTTGSNGQSLEGPDNSVELGVGEQVVVGMTVDTLNNDVSGQLLDSAVLYADANASAPEQSIPEPQYVVTDSPSATNEFGDVQSAVGAAETGSIVGIDGTASLSPSNQINVDVENVTLTGFNGKPTIDLTGFTPSEGAIQISANGVTLQDFNIDYKAGGNGIEANDSGLSDITVDGMRVENTVDPSGQPAINLEKAESVTVTNNEVIGAAIGVYFDGSAQNTSTISNNYVDLNPGADKPAQDSEGGPTEGVFVYGNAANELSNNDLEIRNNEVVDKPTGEEGIKVLDSPSSLNGKSGTEAQIESLLRENNISEADVNGELGTKSSGFPSIQSAVNAANRLTLVDSGLYSESVTVDTAGLTLKGIRDPVIDASGKERGLNIEADGVTVNGLTVDSAGSGVSSGEVRGIFIGNPNGFSDTGEPITIKNVSITNVDGTGTGKSTEGIHIKHYDGEDSIADVDISNVTIDGVKAPSDSYNAGGRGGNGIKLQADISDIDITDTDIKNVSGLWSYGTVLTPSSNESGLPTDITFDGVNISNIVASGGPDVLGVGVGIDSEGGEPTSVSSDVSDPDELSFAATTIRSVEVGLLNKNTNKTLSAPAGVSFISVSDKISNPE